MGFLRRKRLVRDGTAALVLLSGAGGAWWWSRATPAYVPGQGAAGLVDTLTPKAAGGASLRFRDVTEQAGLRFEHFPGMRTGRLPEDMGSGVALGDVDGDGWTDVFLVNIAAPLGAGDGGGGGRCALYRNRGDGTLEDVSDAAGVALERVGMAAAFLDADGDGDLDLLVSSHGGLDLLRNDGRGRFEDVTAAAGLAGLHGFWTGLAMADFDLDGDVDVYVCGYVRYDETAVGAASSSQYAVDIPALLNPSVFAPERNLLLVNRGDGSFEERAGPAGVDNPSGRSLAATFADLDGDGRPDLYVANDVSDNALFLNRGDGTFADATAPALMGDYRGAMGLAVADVDGDGDLDVFVTHWVAQENALYENRSSPGSARPVLFMDVADRVGLGQISLQLVGWATRLVDLDNDGAPDLFVVNGSTIPLAAAPERLGPQRSHLYRNAGGAGGFHEVGRAAGAFFHEEHVGRGGATLDLDLDGDEDLVVTVHGGRARLLRNDSGGEGRSVRVRLRQPEGNTFALGAKLHLEVGGARRFEQLETQGSYLSQHAVGEVGFGLGNAAAAERLTVEWPDGVRESAGPIPAGSLVHWVRGSAPRIGPLPGLRAATSADPLDARAFFRRLDEAARLRLSGDLEGAVAAYRTALAARPDHEDARYHLASSLERLGRREEALAEHGELVRRHPGSSKGWMQIGRLHLARPERCEADLDAAERAFARCHAIHGEESLPVIQLGIVALLRGDLPRAERLLADAALHNPGAVQPPYFLGRIAWLQGDRERARAFLGQARAVAASARDQRGPVAGEGDTASGNALTAEADADAGDPLERWRTLLARPGDPAAEYGSW